MNSNKAKTHKGKILFVDSTIALAACKENTKDNVLTYTLLDLTKKEGENYEKLERDIRTRRM